MYDFLEKRQTVKTNKDIRATRSTIKIKQKKIGILSQIIESNCVEHCMYNFVFEFNVKKSGREGSTAKIVDENGIEQMRVLFVDDGIGTTNASPCCLQLKEKAAM